ncbi:patatin-like phospholipase family protein [bacterium]|nr:patatin-like phospholipase family protein [bacterium]
MKPKLTYVLGSGGARGLAHIGVLNILEKNKLRPDLIIGTSIGALIGGLYAAGASLEEIEEAASKINRWQKFYLFSSLPRTNGLLKGEKIEKLIKKFINNKKFTDLKIPFYAVAVDLISGKEVILKNGLVFRAIRASIAVPGLFTPIVINKKILVDGGLVDPLPVDIACKLASSFIIASTVYSPLKEEKFKKNFGAIAVLRRSIKIMEDMIYRQSIKKIKNLVLIESKVKNYSFWDYDKAKELIFLGEQAAKEKLPLIKKYIKNSL